MSKTFKETINSREWILVAWTAEWCGACKGAIPVLQLVTDEYAKKLSVFPVDVTEYRNEANEYFVRGLPRYSLFHKGKHKYSIAGTKTFREFKDWLDEVMHEDN